MTNFSSDNISGTLVNYYSHCPRQAWLHCNGLHVEDFSDKVKTGRWIDQNTFKRKKEVELSGERIKADFIDESKSPIEVHEVKASSIPKKDHELQVGFYLKRLKMKGVDAVGFIHYPKINKTQKVEFDVIKDKIEKLLIEITFKMNGICPPRLPLKLCKDCSFYEFCYSIEVFEND